MTADSIPIPAAPVSPDEPLAAVVPFPPPACRPLHPEQLLRYVAARIGGPDGAPHSGLTLTGAAGLPETLSATDDVAVRIDWLQHEIQQGPRVSDTRTQPALLSTELADDPRWPEFGSLCAAVIGVHSMVSVLLPLPDGVSATVNFYAEVPGAFTDADVDTALSLSGRAATSLAVHLRELEDGGPTANGRMVTALGIVMARYRVSPAEAFQMLRKASQDLGCDVIDLAAEVIGSGRLPAREINRARRARHRAQGR